MEKAKLVYVFDTYCNWCYSLGTVLIGIQKQFGDTLEYEVISGGMIPDDVPLKAMAEHSSDPLALNEKMENLTGQKFGKKYIQMLLNPEDYEYTYNSLYPSRALATLRHFNPGREIEQAKAIQDLIFQQALDLTKTKNYQSVAALFDVDWNDFVSRFESEDSLDDARYDFQLAKQLKVTSYPAVLIQTGEQYFYLVARGYTPFSDLKERIHRVLTEKSNLPISQNSSAN